MCRTLTRVKKFDSPSLGKFGRPLTHRRSVTLGCAVVIGSSCIQRTYIVRSSATRSIRVRST